MRYSVASADSTGEAFRIGNRPLGYLVYDASGHVFFQALRRSAMDSLRIGAARNAPKAQLYDVSRDSLVLGTDSLRAWWFVRVGPPFPAGAPASR